MTRHRPARSVPTLLLAMLLPLVAGVCASPSASERAMENCPQHPLRDALRAAGRLDVIVTLALEYRPEAELTAEQAEAQRRRIADAQNRLIDELDDTATRVTRRYDRLPMLALHVDEPALCHVLASPLVRSTQQDTESGVTTN